MQRVCSLKLKGQYISVYAQAAAQVHSVGGTTVVKHHGVNCLMEQTSLHASMTACQYKQHCLLQVLHPV